MAADEGGGRSAPLGFPPTLDQLSTAVSTAFPQVEEAVLVIGSKPREIVACNAATERVFGYRAAELLGRDTRLLHVDEESFCEFGRQSEEALARDGAFRSAYRMRRKDGSVFDTFHTVRSISSRLQSLRRSGDAEPELGDLNEAIRGAESLLRGIFRGGTAVELGLGEGPAPVRIERSQVQQLLVNLAMNARDAMPEGGRFRIATERVALSAEDPARPAELAPGAYVLARFEDTGSGVGEKAERVFEDFYTTKGAEGTGLGLAAVRSIVEQAGGHVALESEEGSGTAVRVYLPLAEEPAEG